MKPTVVACCMNFCCGRASDQRNKKYRIWNRWEQRLQWVDEVLSTQERKAIAEMQFKVEVHVKEKLKWDMGQYNRGDDYDGDEM